MKTQSLSLLLWILIVYPAACPGQNSTKQKVSAGIPLRVNRLGTIKFKYPSFTFVRIKYSTAKWKNSWATDSPDADVNFSAHVQKELGLETQRDGKVMTLTDANLKSYPFIYIVEAGTLRLEEAEVPRLRDYLLSGGFLMADDFWGEDEWKSFAAQMKRVFPEREPVELPLEHPVFHCFYEIREKPQVPNVALGKASQYTGITWEREDAKVAHYRGLFDDRGRLMAIFCHNTDLGDGWEREGESEYYFREFSLKKAYPMGINIVVYALTH